MINPNDIRAIKIEHAFSKYARSRDILQRIFSYNSNILPKEVIDSVNLWAAGGQLVTSKWFVNDTRVIEKFVDDLLAGLKK